MSSEPFDAVPFSELLYRPTETTERLSRTRALRLVRSGDDDLVLMPADRAEAEREFMSLAVRVLAAVIEQVPDAVHRLLPTALPWMRHLTSNGARQFGTQFAAVARAGDAAAASQLVIEWRHTAEIYADPELHRALSANFTGNFGEVPRP